MPQECASGCTKCTVIGSMLIVLLWCVDESRRGRFFPRKNLPASSGMMQRTRLQAEVRVNNESKYNTSEEVMILIPIRETNERRHSRLIEMILDLTWPNRSSLHTAMLSDKISMELIRTGNAKLKSGGLASVRAFLEPKDLRRLNPQSSGQLRHGLAAQKPRRAAIALARNYLAYIALGGNEKRFRAIEWVLWLDSDLWSIPPSLIFDLRQSNVDLVVPVCYCRPQSCGPTSKFVLYDRNSWRDTNEAHALVRSLEKSGIISDDVIIVRGYEDPYMPEYILVQNNLAIKHPPLYLSDLNRSSSSSSNQSSLVELDAIGATAILIRADLHRHGLIFPAFSINHTIESEGLAQIARRMGVTPYGRTDVSVFHA